MQDRMTLEQLKEQTFSYVLIKNRRPGYFILLCNIVDGKQGASTVVVDENDSKVYFDSLDSAFLVANKLLKDNNVAKGNIQVEPKLEPIPHYFV